MGESKHESQRHIFDPNELEVPCVIVDVEIAQSPSRGIGHMVDNCASDELTTAGVGFIRGLGQNSAQFDASEPVFGACGAAALYRRRVLDEIGSLDEDFFLYDEDTDLNFRDQLAGWKCIYIYSAIVYNVANETARGLC